MGDCSVDSRMHGSPAKVVRLHVDITVIREPGRKGFATIERVQENKSGVHSAGAKTGLHF